ncbi:ABC transporter ATP-binding protein [Companilactobacillus sp. HBUAS59544]|uniref:ABC transporter ATP-binding protein n=1 Tax=Companilactobacillus sp. HBUAS59544 TaxID=3109363 RepID=UPI002FF127F3
MVEILRFEDYSFRYNNSQKLSLNKIDLSVEKGDFLVLIGQTGSGKSTLLKQLLQDLVVGSVVSGRLVTDLELDNHNFAYVSQFVDNQMIMETPRDELKFVLDNQGLDENQSQMRITEIASYLGIVGLLDLNEKHLSGGQKQLVNLASALILKPKVLLLDEPTSQLDPIASEKLMQMIKKVNEELNITILLVEHEIDHVIGLANRLLVMDSGRLILDEAVRDGLQKIYTLPKFKNYLTQVDRLAMELKLSTDLPLSNKKVGQLVSQNKSLTLQASVPSHNIGEIILQAKKISFRFDYNGRQIIDNVSLNLRSGQSFCVVGPNGMGKTTLLKILTQQLKQQAGQLRFAGHKIKEDFYQKVFVLPQNPAILFMKETVAEELTYQIEYYQSNLTLKEVLQKFSLVGLEKTSPYDLSGGQQEFLALALGFIKQPQLLFLDEPTKGLDPNKRIELGEMLNEYQENGGTIFVNSHDLLFAAKYFDFIAMMFDGKLSQFMEPRQFFKDKFFYTTEINQALRDTFPTALIWEDILKRES